MTLTPPPPPGVGTALCPKKIKTCADIIDGVTDVTDDGGWLSRTRTFLLRGEKVLQESGLVCAGVLDTQPDLAEGISDAHAKGERRISVGLAMEWVRAPPQLGDYLVCVLAVSVKIVLRRPQQPTYDALLRN